ncbi:MAG: adenylate/guanylate cyclase domain-containing protein [Nevskiales bacterium]
MTEYLPSTIASVMALGMAAAFYGADRASPTSRVLALAFAALALSFGLGVPLIEPHRGGQVPWYAGLFGLGHSVAMIAFLEWILRVRRTVPAGKLDVRFADYGLRLAQAAAVVYGVLTLLFPDTHQRDFLGAVEHLDDLAQPGFWLFAAPTVVVFANAGMGLQLLLKRRPDRPERARVLAAWLAGPFFLLSLALPHEAAAASVAVGETIFLVGAVQYHVLQGQRGEFMSRFLSPQVAQLVRDRGLLQTIQHQQAEITIVCCDLRGFTAYAQAHASGEVVELLREYYDAAGEAAAEFGATIKDFAGDGVLLLVGAPLAQADHAAKGLELARRLRASISALTARWSDSQQRLGVGLGVASGLVTVGVINSTSRLEYTAVGAAVNLASRLCERAVDGEILAAEPTVRMAAAGDFTSGEPIELHGFPGTIPLFASRASAPQT